MESGQSSLSRTRVTSRKPDLRYMGLSRSKCAKCSNSGWTSGSTHRRMAELEDQNAKLTRALNEERLKKNSVQNEKDALQKTVSDLEARSMRKLTELYNELRQVHRRLEADLRGVRDANEFEVDVVPGSEYEINTYGVSRNMSGKESYGGNGEEVTGSGRGSEIIRDRRRTSADYNDRRDHVDHDEGSHSGARRMSTPGDVLFSFARNRSPTTNIKLSAPTKNVGGRGARRRRHHIDPRPDVEEEESHRDRRG
ncbi:hypothetical protein FGB62_7g636 [Gracilaria domingensis]|nr:hypothetical protein FGB62_7g636 [Gracilaria domingensis]